MRRNPHCGGRLVSFPDHTHMQLLEIFITIAPYGVFVPFPHLLYLFTTEVLFISRCTNFLLERVPDTLCWSFTGFGLLVTHTFEVAFRRSNGLIEVASETCTQNNKEEKELCVSSELNSPAPELLIGVIVRSIPRAVIWKLPLVSLITGTSCQIIYNRLKGGTSSFCKVRLLRGLRTRGIGHLNTLLFRLAKWSVILRWILKC